MCFCSGRGKICALVGKGKGVAKKCFYNKIWMRILRGQEDEDKRILKFDLFSFLFKTMFLGHISPPPKKKPKKQHIDFLVHVHSSWSTFSLHLEKGQKTFVNWFFKESDHGGRSMKQGHIFHGPTSWSMCKPALMWTWSKQWSGRIGS